KIDVAFDTAFVAGAGRVDGDDLLAVFLKVDVDAVARRARHLADDGTLALGQAVDERALAGVTATDDGKLESYVLHRPGFGCRPCRSARHNGRRYGWEPPAGRASPPASDRRWRCAAPPAS